MCRCPPLSRPEFRLFRGTESAQNSVPSHSVEEKKSRNSVANHFAEDTKSSEFGSEPFKSKKNTRRLLKYIVFSSKFAIAFALVQYDAFDLWKVIFLLLCWLFRQASFLVEFHSVPNLGMGCAVPRHTEFRENNTFSRGITKTVPSHSAKLIWNGISMAKLGGGDTKCSSSKGPSG